MRKALVDQFKADLDLYPVAPVASQMSQSLIIKEIVSLIASRQKKALRNARSSLKHGFTKKKRKKTLHMYKGPSAIAE